MKRMEYKDKNNVRWIIDKRLEVMFWLIILLWLITLIYFSVIYVRIDRLGLVSVLIQGCR